MTEARPAPPLAWNREKVYRWICGHAKCKAARGLDFNLRNSMSASRHATKYEGHNVIISMLRPDGEYELVKVILHAVKPKLEEGEIPF